MLFGVPPLSGSLDRYVKLGSVAPEASNGLSRVVSPVPSPSTVLLFSALNRLICAWAVTP